VSALSVFAFGEQVVRIADRDGAPWFVGRDVCACLAIKNERHAVGRLPADEKDVVIGDTLGGKQEMVIISEAGMYRLVLTSRTEPAERFKTWVVQDVLPSIRRTGAYRLPGAANDAAPADGIAALFETERGCSTINAKLALVRTAGRTFGPLAAQEAWRRIDLPDVAPEASPHYRPAPDPGMARWIADRVELMPMETAQVGDLYADYVHWCRWFDGATARDEHLFRQFLADRGAVIDGERNETVRGMQLREAQSMHEHASGDVVRFFKARKR
jgi:hypothetical protein